MEAKQKEAEYRDNQIGIDFTTCPEEDCKLLSIQLSESLLLGRSFLLTIFLIPNCKSPFIQVSFL